MNINKAIEKTSLFSKSQLWLLAFFLPWVHTPPCNSTLCTASVFEWYIILTMLAKGISVPRHCWPPEA